MAQRTGGLRRKTRYIFKRRRSDKGKVKIRDYLQSFKEGDRVELKANPSVHRGLYFRRFHAKVGTIKKQRGDCYEVSIKEGNKAKIVITHPIHLEKCQK